MKNLKTYYYYILLSLLLFAAGLLFLASVGLIHLDFFGNERVDYYPGGIREVSFSDNGQTQIDGASSVVFNVPAVFHISERKQFDDYVELLPSGSGNIGVVGADAQIEDNIDHHRDGISIFFVSGIVNCPAADYSGCQLIVDHLTSVNDLPLAKPQFRQVTDLEGLIVSAQVPDNSSPDYFFVSYLNQPVVYLISSEDAYVEQQLHDYAGTGHIVQVDGVLTFGDAQSLKFPRIEGFNVNGNNSSLVWNLKPEELSSLKNSISDLYARLKTNLARH